MTYGELLTRARAGAANLEPGARVGIALAPGEDFAVALHAALLAGSLVVPIDPRLTEAERPDVDVVVDRTLPARCAAAAQPYEHDLDAPAILVHTSGTTSAPKPVRLTFGNWLWSALGSGVALGIDPDERWLCTLPLSHVGGLSILLRSAIYGTSAVVHDRFDTERVLELLRRPDGPTLVSLVPTTLARLVYARLRAPPRRSSRWCPRRWRACSPPGCASRPRCGGRCSAGRRCPPRCWRAPPRR